MATVSFSSIGKVYGDGTRALAGLSLDVVDGEFMGTDGGRSVRRRRGGFSPTTSPAETLIPSAPIDSRPVRGACTPEAGQPAMPAPSG